jgi:hypothetical protein
LVADVTALNVPPDVLFATAFTVTSDPGGSGSWNGAVYGVDASFGADPSIV